MTSSDTLTVSPWTVVMAIRYGLGRSTSSAHNDALTLIRQHWDALPADDQRAITADLTWLSRSSTWVDVRESSRQTLQSIKKARPA